MTKWIAQTTIPKPLRFIIEHDELVGFYLYVFEENVDTHDFLQDTLAAAKQIAFEGFGVPLDAWHEVSD